MDEDRKFLYRTPIKRNLALLLLCAVTFLNCSLSAVDYLLYKESSDGAEILTGWLLSGGLLVYLAVPCCIILFGKPKFIVVGETSISIPSPYFLRNKKINYLNITNLLVSGRLGARICRISMYGNNFLFKEVGLDNKNDFDWISDQVREKSYKFVMYAMRDGVGK